MGIAARSVRPLPGAPKRKLRNYLLDRRFQLKYTSMVVGVTMVVASILGALAYHESKGLTEMLQIQLATQPDLDPGVADTLVTYGRDRDRDILVGILAGIAALTIALGLTGIIITHKMVGPAYKMRLLLTRVAEGHLRVDGGLRKGDELRDVFNAFNAMVTQLRTRREQDVERIASVLQSAESGVDTRELVRQLSEAKDRMQSELD